MIYFFCIQQELWKIYNEVCSPQARSDAELMEDVFSVVDQVSICRCPQAHEALRLYGGLISLHRASLTEFFRTSGIKREDPSHDWSELTLYQQLEIIRQGVLFHPRMERAFLALLQSIGQLLPDPSLIQHYRLMDADELDVKLLRDPSKPECWLDLASAHHRAGSEVRARQLLQRAATSTGKEADTAASVLRKWVASVWMKPSSSHSVNRKK